MLHHFKLDLEGRTLAFERLISAVRRRAVEIRWLKFGTGSGCSMAQVEFFVEATEAEATRLEANLWKLQEARAIERSATSRMPSAGANRFTALTIPGEFRVG